MTDPGSEADPPQRRARYARVAVEVEPYHLDRPFDYRIPAEVNVVPGSRVLVTFAGRSVRGVVLETTDDSDVPDGRVRDLRRPLGDFVWMDTQDRALARWAADRYAAPLGDVLRHALPGRVVDVERQAAEAGWFPPGAGRRPTDEPVLADLREGWTGYGTAAEPLLEAVRGGGAGAFYWRPLPDEEVADRVGELVQATLAAGRDALVLVPDHASPTAEAVVNQAGDLCVDLRGDVPPRRNYRAWLRARCGQARVVLGERGVAFWPLERLGLALVLDESNPAYKERRSPRHHVREVALERARRAGAVAVLVGWVPSAPAWRLLADGRLVGVIPQRGLERDRAPLVTAATAEGRVRTRLLPEAMDALRDALEAGSYGVVLASRRGEGRVLACTRCGDRLTCPDCGASLDPTRGGRGTRCPRCGRDRSEPPTCAACGADRFAPLAAGVRRLASELRRSLDGAVAALEGYDAEAPPPPAILVMTRGSVLDRPPGPVRAAVLPDFDTQVRRPGLDAAEDTLRLGMQVARWTVLGNARGRGEVDDPRDAGRVVVQTREPEHPVVQALVRWDPGGFWRKEAAARAELRFPPAATAIRVRVPGDRGEDLLEDLVGELPAEDRCLGPVGDGDQAEILIKAADRVASVRALRELRRRWSADGTDLWIDVDPVDVS